MLPNLVPDMPLAAQLLDTLRERTADIAGVTREAAWCMCGHRVIAAEA